MTVEDARSISRMVLLRSVVTVTTAGPSADEGTEHRLVPHLLAASPSRADLEQLIHTIEQEPARDLEFMPDLGDDDSRLFWMEAGLRSTDEAERIVGYIRRAIEILDQFEPERAQLLDGSN